MHDLIVLGGGPAGLTAAIYAVNKRLDVLLITRNLGGKTNFHLQLPFIERHMVINGDEVISRFTREIEYLDFVRVMEHAEAITAINSGYEVRLANGEKHQAKALIFALGAKPQLLDVPGEKEFMMRGLCYSAISYAQLFIDRAAVVIGEGELALRGTAELAQVAQQVTLVAANGDELDTPLGRKLQAMNHVDFLVGYHVKAVKGDMYARSTIVTGPDGDRELEMDAVFIEKDLIPRTTMVEGLVELNEKGFIKVNCRAETNRPGFFAAGDVTDGYAEQVLICIGDGAKAALSAYEYLLKLEEETAPAG
jgi:thioredoxin reductase